VLLADEPTSSLDDENSELLVRMLCRINREEKVTVILTTTDLYEKLPTTNDYVLKNGEIQNEVRVEWNR
jgi:putative ABC transport system ATP-binding protein